MIEIGELTPAEDAAISAALSTLPPMTDEAVDRVVALWAALDAQEHDARRRTAVAAERER